MPCLRMGFDSMAAWDKNAPEFEDHIHRRRAVTDSQIICPLNLRSAPPPFRQATSQWSPPISPTTPTLSPERHKSEPVVLTPPSSPPIKPITEPTPAERVALATKLYAASCAGDASQVSHLLSIGAPINASSLVKGLFDGFRPAKNGHLCALAGAATHGKLEVVKLLVAAGALVNPDVNQSSSSPLHQACYADHLELVRFLLSAGADINAQNTFKSTPLMYAVKYGSPAVVALVLSYYPRLEMAGFAESTAVHWCVFNNPAGLAMLLRAGANPDAQMADGSSALHMAAMSGKEDLVRLLLAFGADASLKDAGGQTVVDVALSIERDNIVALLRGTRAFE